MILVDSVCERGFVGIGKNVDFAKHEHVRQENKKTVFENNTCISQPCVQ